MTLPEHYHQGEGLKEGLEKREAEASLLTSLCPFLDRHLEEIFGALNK